MCYKFLIVSIQYKDNYPKAVVVIILYSLTFILAVLVTELGKFTIVYTAQ